MDQHAVQQVRSFNRTVTEGVGALDDHFLGRPRPLGESRLLWEIGPNGAEVRALRMRLSLDSGYISRVLRSLEEQGLVRVAVGRDDRRVRRATLTKRGLAECAELDRRSATEFAMGPSFAVRTPVERIVQFQMDGHGAAQGLTMRPTGGAATVAAREASRDEDVEFRQGDTTLAGTLIASATPGPHPAIVLLHGSGP